MADVFISYKREERDKAKGLAEAIVKRGYSVWWDVDLLPGDRFAREIDAVIGKAKAAIVLWSAASINSDWVIAEATEAKKRQILIPARLDGAEPPLYFRGDHSIDLSEWDGAAVSPAIEPILAAIERRVGAPSARPSVAASVVADALAAPNLEAEFWRTVSGAPVQTIREYEAYLQK
ncbi:MAG: toll/interleukin-1 receptor domain-containing protein, partial [Parvularculaceae bacterium]